MRWLFMIPMLWALPLKPINTKFDKQTYFAADLPSASFREYLKKAETLHGGSLRTRGEFHITIVTPPEYLKLTDAQRQQIQLALTQLDWEREPLRLRCIGRGEKELQGQKEKAYFLVVDAPGLRKIRETVGLPDYYPHVTLGFTKRDLHFEDGVKKDISSCILKLP